MNARSKALKTLVEESLRANGGDAHEVAEALLLAAGMKARPSNLPSGLRKIAFTFDPERAGETEQDRAERIVDVTRQRSARRKRKATGSGGGVGGGADPNRYGLVG